jgi:hypothetical protein
MLHSVRMAYARNCAAGRALQGKATWYCAQRADDSRVQSPDDGLPNTCVGVSSPPINPEGCPPRAAPCKHCNKG